MCLSEFVKKHNKYIDKLLITNLNLLSSIPSFLLGQAQWGKAVGTQKFQQTMRYEY